MDKRILILIACTVLVSGCTDLIDTNSSPDGIEPDPGKGLEITSLDVADDTLRAGQGNEGQRTEIRLQLSNHHDMEIEPSFEIANEGQLDVSDGQCNQGSLAPVREETVDQMECTWGVVAPDQDTVGAFDEKHEEVSLIINYDSQISNQEPLQVQFQDRGEIAGSDRIERKFSNNEVVMTIRTDNPSPINSNYNQFEMDFANMGGGDVTSSGYGISYTPESIFSESCPTEGEGRIESEYSASCSFDVDSAATRNIFISAEYKYQKQQNLPITIVR